jgi:serine/threonine-protein kinase PknG
MNCAQPGCTGSIVDGYCDVCGMAPAPSPAPSPASAPAAAPAPASSSVSVPQTPGPSTLTSTSTGSARRATTGRTRSTGRARLGAGLVEIPSVPFRDPADAVLGPAAIVP